MTSLVILGATGLVGQAILAVANGEIAIKAVARRPPLTDPSQFITWYSLDLSIPCVLDHVLEEGDIVINLVYLKSNSLEKNLALIDNIIQSCLYKKIKRLLHCSTAMVVGNTPDNDVNESTNCLPLSQYEKVKYSIDQYLLSKVFSEIDVIILRPTAIVGAHSKNLEKLTTQLLKKSRVINYLRASLFQRRPMHLVPVRYVAEAILYLAFKPETMNEIYIISADNDPDNNYLSVENKILATLKLKARKLPLLPLPISLLSVLLKILRRSEYNLNRKYSSCKLLSTSFRSTYTIMDAIEDMVSNFNK